MTRKPKPKTNHAAEATLRALLHGVLNGDPESERKARELLYGKATSSEGTSQGEDT